ncbi:MAG: molybdopterin-guanine dinucleotide biosynthesis protein MobB [Candidatus Lokiarchaeota archaeon]|nr:molybdopterin-guanine dinucleotide biosynthesis protein MobB [Candidatus Harpocratesius repetitus]
MVISIQETNKSKSPLFSYLSDKKIPLISFIGYSHSGKTASIEKIITSATQIGFQCVVMKKTNHSSPIFDTPGKNTWKYSRKGAGLVIGRTQVEIASFMNESLNDEQYEKYCIITIAFFQDLHPDKKILVISEGFRNFPGPHILCADTIEDIQKQMNPNIKVISGKITSNQDNIENLTKQLQIPMINCLTNPNLILKIFNLI